MNLPPSPTANQPLLYTTSDALALVHGIKGIVYGMSGSGKTSLVATAPRPFMIQAENGQLSLTKANIERIHGIGTPGINYSIPMARVSTLAQLEQVMADMLAPAFWDSFDTLYIDSFSEIIECMLKAALAENKDGRAAYGEMADAGIAFLKYLRDLPGKNVIATCEQGFSRDVNLIGPSMLGNIMDRKSPYIADIVLQACIGIAADGSKYHWLRTQPDATNFAKDRSGLLDPRGEQPYLYNIFRKISAAIG